MKPLNRLTCEEAFRRLDDFLDSELAPAELDLVRQHLEICEGCAREFRFEASVLDNVRSKLRDVAVPADLVSRIRALAGPDSEGGDPLS